MTDNGSPSPEGDKPGAVFAALGLAPDLVEAVVRVGYTEPTEIQRLAIPAALEGRDILGTAHTGTGKTAAFTLPMIQLLAGGDHLDHPRGLVVTPTRELAQQVGAAVARYGAASSIEAVIVHGGTSVRGEANELRFGCDVLVATPGRLLDHLNRGAADLSGVEVLVLDEADRMLDMGFIDDVKEIVAATPKSRQTFLFSATMPNGVMWLAQEMMRDPMRVNVGLEAAAEGIQQVVHPVDWARKHQLLLHVLEEMTSGQVLVFTRTRDTANYLSEFLGAREVSVDDMHGGKSQGERDSSLTRFREGRTRILVATNVAARGLDIRGIKHVINFDVPEDPRDYVHRVGRTARGDETGDAITLVSPGDWLLVRQIEALTGEQIERVEVEGFEPSVPPPDSRGDTEDAYPAGPDRPRSALSRGIRKR
jgi:ATP-dependent RNA helicase RhlE